MDTAPDTRHIERTEVISDQEYVTNTVLQFLSKAEKINSCGDYKALSLIFEAAKDNSKIINKLYDNTPALVVNGGLSYVITKTKVISQK
jgi:hypothetical protein